MTSNPLRIAAYLEMLTIWFPREWPNLHPGSDQPYGLQKCEDFNGKGDSIHESAAFSPIQFPNRFALTISNPNGF